MIRILCKCGHLRWLHRAFRGKYLDCPRCGRWAKAPSHLEKHAM